MGEQTDREGVPPWERPGTFRFDCEPHRGQLLERMGVASALTGILSLLVVPAVMALPLAVATWAMARRDLGLMARRLMDPGGEIQTRSARAHAQAGLACALLGAALVFYLLPAAIAAWPTMNLDWGR